MWATTPIAETLYDIGQYVSQGNHPTGSDLNGSPWPQDEVRQGYPTAPSPNHTPLYENNDGVTPHSNAGAHPAFKVNNTWDPYYYASFSSKLPCGKTFVLHFNDGAPYTDWDTTNGFTVPSDFVGDGDGKYGENEALDDVALMFRNQDIRSDLSGHQEIISYYVLAALGTDPADVGKTPRNRLMEAAANGGFKDKDGNHLPDVAHPVDFVNHIATNAGVCTPNEWDEDGDCEPDAFYFANDGFKLETELLAAFQSILKRVASGGAASVLAGSTKGEGAVYQARFEQEHAAGGLTVNWIGDVTATLIDDAGRLREDTNTNQTLDVDPQVDEIIDMCYNVADQETRIATSDDPANRPSAAQFAACSDTVFNKNLFTAKYLWSAGEELASLTDAQVLTQRSYSSTTGRHLLTTIDGSGAAAADGLIQRDEQQAFEDATFSGKEGLLAASTSAEAQNIVDFTRGHSSVPGYRSREIEMGGNVVTWRLSDIIHSSPVTVAAPAEDYDLIYGGTGFGATYNAFRKAYLTRRTVVYAGANDGMLHAFNGGYYDPANKKYKNGLSGTSQYPLGAELWAYIPYHLLPHLKYLTDPTYGTQDGNHLYMVDFEPRIFDARIFNDSATSTSGGVDGQASVSHPKGWGTILVGAMRFGGGPVAVDIDNDGTPDQTLRSSFFILDITDPEKPPQVLFEYSTADLGFTMATPTPILKNNGSGVDEWYLLLGSGPHDPSTPPTGLRDATSAQHAKLTLLNLKTMSVETNFGTSGIYTLNGPSDAANTFITGMLPVDYDLDTQTDAVYISTVNGTVGSFAGKLYRLALRNSDGSSFPNSGSYKDITAWAPNIMLDSIGPVTALPNAAVDTFGNRWVYLGTGRFLVRSDAADSSPQAFYGVKEPRDATKGGFTWGAVNKSKVVDVTGVKVDSNGDLSANVNTKSTAGNVGTFTALKVAMTHVPTSTPTFNANHGWLRDLGQSPKTIYERNVGQPAVLGGTLSFTTFEPSGDVCKYEGKSNLYAVDFRTGTASTANVLGTALPDPGDPAVDLDDVVDLGPGLVQTVSLHSGKGYKNVKTGSALTQSSTAQTSITQQQNAFAVSSGEASWRVDY